MKICMLTLGFVWLFSGVAAQSELTNIQIDSLNTWLTDQMEFVQDSALVQTKLYQALKSSTSGTSQRGKAYQNLAIWHQNSAVKDSTLWYLDKAVTLYSDLKTPKDLAATYLLYEDMYKLNTKYNEASQFAFKALEIYETEKDTEGIAESFLRLSDLFSYKNDIDRGIEYAQKAIDLLANTDAHEQLAKAYQYRASNQLSNSENEIALSSINKAIAILETQDISNIRYLSCRNTRGNILKYLEQYDDAIADYSNNLKASNEINDIRLQIASNGNLGHIKIIQEKYKAAIPYLLSAIDLIKKSGNLVNLWENYMHAAVAYEQTGDFEKALDYERLLGDENKTYYKSIIARQEGELAVKYETAKKEETIALQEDQIDRQRKTELLYIGLAVLFATLLLFMYFSRKNIRKKRKELASLNTELNEKSGHLKEANTTLSQTITNLKSTQEQLIQSEKMASLGELTAGIAHEIQNPLNFVNNFSELNTELLDELKEAIASKDVEEIEAISADLSGNMKKILHHGQRADGIVKGMLQHSRKNTEEKTPADLNQLTDEYLRLAYHGLRAKDKSFNATLNTDFDQNAMPIPVLAQNIGRVVLNLVTNAFHAVKERKENTKDESYMPTVGVRTQQTKKLFIIEISDNGIGIPEEIRPKIFQPFFTTKPTGEGTGLGLSLSYDIVKSHDGILSVESEEGKGTTFKIELPLN